MELEGATHMVESADVKQRVRDFIKQSFLFGDEEERLSDTSSFLETGIIDSTGILELIGFVEREFMFTVGESEMLPENLDTVDNIAAYVMQKANQN